MALAATPFLTDPEPVVEWLQPMTQDFGDLNSRDEVSLDFKFRNISPDTLTIDAVRPDCGCTFSDWTDDAIPPDSIGILKVYYAPKGPGYFKEKIRVFFNSQRKSEKIFVEGYVVE